MIRIRSEMLTSVTVQCYPCKRNGANIIAAQRFTVWEWHVLASVCSPAIHCVGTVLVLPPRLATGLSIVGAHYHECLYR